MVLQKLLIFYFSFCVLSTLAKEYPKEIIDSTETILQKEIDRFHQYSQKFQEHHANISVIFTYLFKGENDNVLKRDSIEISPIYAKKIEGIVVPEKYDQSVKKETYDFAKAHNLTFVASRQTFDDDGILKSKHVDTEDVKIEFEDGNSHIQFSAGSDDGEEDDDESIEEYMGILKAFELPVTIEKQLYDESGAVIQTDKSSYQPEKVQIVSVSNMPVDMQMKVAEALKRSCSLKDEGKKRIMLLVRYLGIQFPEYTFEAAIGDGLHYVSSDISVKVLFNRVMYQIWGTAVEQDEDSDDDD